MATAHLRAEYSDIIESIIGGAVLATCFRARQTNDIILPGLIFSTLGRNPDSLHLL
jgi:hypothetical protein